MLKGMLDVRLVLIVETKAKGSAVIRNSHLKWPARSEESVPIQAAVCDVIFPRSSVADKVVFRIASSNVCLNFIVALDIVRNKDADVDRHKVGRFSPNVPRFGFIFWLVIHDKLPTVERINSWSVRSTRSLSRFVI